MSSYLKDELDGIDIRLKPDADSVEMAKVVTAILNSTHNNTQDFTVTIPAALLAQQKRTQTIFTYVMVAIAAISLLVGGIGIMNIVLATVMERTQGDRRPPGDWRAAKRYRAAVPDGKRADLDGRRSAGHRLWLLRFPGSSRARRNGRRSSRRISVIIAFGVSVAVGVVFGIYPGDEGVANQPD